MNRARLAILSAIVLVACGIDDDDDDDAPTECMTVPDNHDDAVGDLALVDTDEQDVEPVYAQRISIGVDGRVAIDFGGVEVDFERPREEGRYTLAELGARFCSWEWMDCPPVDGVIDVTTTGPRAFEAVVDIGAPATIRDDLVIQGTGRFRHIEDEKTVC